MNCFLSGSVGSEVANEADGDSTVSSTDGQGVHEGNRWVGSLQGGAILLLLV